MTWAYPSEGQLTQFLPGIQLLKHGGVASESQKVSKGNRKDTIKHVSGLS